MKKKKKYKIKLKSLNQHKDTIRKMVIKYNNKIPLNEIFIDNIGNRFCQTDSWFKMKKGNIQEKKKYNFRLSKTKIPNKIIKCKKINILFTSIQRKIIFDWFKGYLLMYNLTIKYFRKCNFLKEPISTNFKYIRTYKLKETKNIIRKKYNIPSHMLDGAIKLACISLYP
tara:strand:+ start:462 stop:968 length:507 start_codon:yes stop_codon:yes gene_type:complete